MHIAQKFFTRPAPVVILHLETRYTFPTFLMDLTFLIHKTSLQLMEIAGAFGSLKAYHFGAEDTDEHCAFLEVRKFSIFIVIICVV